MAEGARAVPTLGRVVRSAKWCFGTGLAPWRGVFGDTGIGIAFEEHGGI